MHPRTVLVGWLSIVAVTVALPIPENEGNSLGQDIARASLWVIGTAAFACLALNGIGYGTNWWHRFKLMQVEHEGSRSAWDASHMRKQKQHEKQLQGLDIILDVARNYTKGVGKTKSQTTLLAIDKPEVEDATLVE